MTDHNNESCSLGPVLRQIIGPIQIINYFIYKLTILFIDLFAGTGPNKIVDLIYQKTFVGTSPSTIINLNFQKYVCWDRSTIEPA